MDAGREVEVGTAEVDHPLEELVDMQVAGLGLVTEAAHHLGPGRGHRLLGHRDLDLVANAGLPATIRARRRNPAVHGVEKAPYLVAGSDGRLHLPTRRLLDGENTGTVAWVSHGHQQLGTAGFDGHRHAGPGQLGGNETVDAGLDLGLVEVDERHAHLVGDRRHEVLLRHHAVGCEQPGQRRTLTRLAVEHDLEVVAGEDLAVYEELAQPARRTQHDGGIGTQGRALEMAPMRRLGGSPRWRWRPRTPGRSPPGAASSSPGPAPPS